MAAVAAAVVAATGLVVTSSGPAYATPIDVTDVPGGLTDQYNTTGIEGAEKAIDNTPYLKYFTLNPTTWLQYVTSHATVVTGYSITSANDYADRDPRDWVFEASPDLTTWVTLDTRSNETFVSRHLRKVYTFSNTTAYPVYRLRITANAGAAGTQLAEWEIFGTTDLAIPPPSAPSNLTAQGVSGDQILLNWEDNTLRETRYRLERSTDGTNWNWSRELPIGTTRFHDIELPPNTQYHYRVRAENDSGQSAYLTASATTGGPDLPTTWQEHWGEHDQLLSRQTYNDDVAVYFDGDVDPAAAAWIDNRVTTIWQYVKQTYGSFSNPRLAAVCHDFRYSGGHPANIFQADHDYRNAIDIGGVGDWTLMTTVQRDIIMHEIGHIVEFASLGVRESPAFGIWGDSKWAEIFGYDVYVGLGMTAEADRVYNADRLKSDTFPRADRPTYWFRDWFYPIWSNYGQTEVLQNFFELLAEHFPQHNGAYARDLNMGELLHFWSGAAGVNLRPLAITAFGWDEITTWEQQFVQAQIDFPGVTYV